MNTYQVCLENAQKRMRKAEDRICELEKKCDGWVPEMKLTKKEQTELMMLQYDKRNELKNIRIFEALIKEKK